MTTERKIKRMVGYKFTKMDMQTAKALLAYTPDAKEVTLPVSGDRGYVDGFSGIVMESDGIFFTFDLDFGEYWFCHCKDFVPEKRSCCEHLYAPHSDKEMRWVMSHVLDLSEIGVRVFDLGPNGYWFGLDETTATWRKILELMGHSFEAAVA